MLIDFLENSKDDISSEEIQNKIFSIGKELKYEHLKDWFLGLYETVLGQSNGPRMGGLIKLIPFTYALMFIGSYSLLGFPFFARISICEPPGNSTPKSFATLSKASPIASSIVVPSLL